MAYNATNKQATVPSDAELVPKTENAPLPEFTAEQFSFQPVEGYRQKELPHSQEFKPLAKKWQFRWFDYLEGIQQTGKADQGFFKVVRKGDGYQGYPFSQMFCDDAWDASGFITRSPRRDQLTGSLVFDQVLCARPYAAWEANQAAIAQATKRRLGPDKQSNAVQQQVKNIVASSEISVVQSDLKTDESGRW